ncbi:MAG TPA: hypothetical protein VF147_03310 [Vicinamibacterales bacterium]
MHISRSLRGLGLAVAAVGFVCAVQSAAAQTGGETFTATATFKGQSRPVTIQITRQIAAADRDKLATLLKAGDSAGLHKALASMPDLGYLEVGGVKTPIKYAFARPTGSGRMVTVVTAKALAHLGSAGPDAKPKEGYDFALALLVLNGADTGDGELTAATQLKLNESGAFVTDKYEGETIRLTGVTKKSS